MFVHIAQTGSSHEIVPFSFFDSLRTEDTLQPAIDVAQHDVAIRNNGYELQWLHDSSLDGLAATIS